MKKIFVCLISLSLALVFCFGVTTDVAAAYNNIESASISGRGIIYVPADTVSISFCVETRSENSRDAVSINEKTIGAIKSACGGLGCISEDSFYSYEDPCSDRQTVTRCLTLLTSKLDSVGSLTQKLIDSGATSVNYVCYSLKDAKPYESKALGLAIEDAQKRASETGLNLPLTEINESCCWSHYDGRCDKDGRHLVAVECNVSVTFKRID